MKTKLDKNGITIFTIESKQDCIDVLHDLKRDTLKNEYLYEFIPQIDNTIKAIKEDSLNEQNHKALQQLAYE